MRISFQPGIKFPIHVFENLFLLHQIYLVILQYENLNFDIENSEIKSRTLILMLWTY